MKLSQLIKTLTDAKKKFGDIPAAIMSEETGNWHHVTLVVKLHPYTAAYRCMNRDEPVNVIGITWQRGMSEDLILSENSNTPK